jgi:hypothetical protein
MTAGGSGTRTTGSVCKVVQSRATVLVVAAREGLVVAEDDDATRPHARALEKISHQLEAPPVGVLGAHHDEEVIDVVDEP